MKNYHIIYFLFILLFTCANSDESKPKTKSDFECEFKPLYNQEITTREKSGNISTKEINLTLSSNIKKMADLSIDGEIKDSTISNLKTVIEKNTVQYTREFIQTHNGIIQILCSLDRDLHDTTLSNSERKRTFNERMEQRSRYSDFIYKYYDERKKSTPTENNLRKKINYSPPKIKQTGIDTVLNIFVDSFVQEDGLITERTKELKSFFESHLARCQNVAILDRNNYEKILKKRKLEDKLTGTKYKGKIFRVGYVITGELKENVITGEFLLQVQLTNLNTTHIVDTEEVILTKSDIKNYKMQKKITQELVSKICENI